MAVTAVVKRKFSMEMKEYFKSLDLRFPYYPLSVEKTYKSIERFYEFVVKQKEYWAGCNGNKTKQIQEHFLKIIQHLDQVELYQTSNLQHAKTQLLNAINLIKINRFPCVFESPEGDFIKEQYKIHPDRADAACEYMFDPNGNRQISVTLTHIHQYEGVIQSFLFKNPNVQKNIFTSLDESFEALKSRYVQTVNEVDDQYLEKIEEITAQNNSFKDEVSLWKNELTSSTEVFVEDKKGELDKFVMINLLR